MLAIAAARREDVVILDLTSALASYPEVLNPLPGHAPCGVTDPVTVSSRLSTR